MPDNDAGRHDFGSSELSASVLAEGAELCALSDESGQDYIWPALPAWPRHAPVLFPIVGRLKDDRLTHDGSVYRMTQHGFARDRRFEWSERSDAGCRLTLRDDAQTRAIYPFPFRFEVAYAVTGGALDIVYTVTNTGEGVLPASMGAHPAFRWPLVAGTAKDSYSLVFDAAEPGPLRRVAGGLLTPNEYPSPVQGRTLRLNEELFAADALIFPHPASQSVRFAAEGAPGLTVSWDGFEQLGVWSRAGGDFLCIEPWHGMASPADFDGDFMDKPWLMLIAPGASRRAHFRIAVETPR